MYFDKWTPRLIFYIYMLFFNCFIYYSFLLDFLLFPSMTSITLLIRRTQFCQRLVRLLLNRTIQQQLLVPLIRQDQNLRQHRSYYCSTYIYIKRNVKKNNKKIKKIKRIKTSKKIKLSKCQNVKENKIKMK